MVYDYLVTLKKPDYRFVDQVSQLLYIFALLAFGYFWYYSPNGYFFYPVIAALILLCWAFSLYKKRMNGQAFFRLGLLVAAAGWFLGTETNIWMGILYALAGILEKQVKFPQEIGFAEHGIYFNSIPKKIVSWSAVNNVVIKDGLLTIDQKNNRIYQKEIEGYVTAEIEIEFNAYAAGYMAGKS